MMNKPIILNHLSLSFASKTCIEDFSSHIYPMSRIAIVGRNGTGKSSLLRLLCQQIEPTEGNIIFPDGIRIGYVKQTIDEHSDLSGGQRFNKKLSEALANDPDLLLLDEPTNHLDRDNRKSLMRMLNKYHGTLIVVTHDKELISQCTDILWHIDNHSISQFSGSYDDYLRDIQIKRASIEKRMSQLSREKKDTHDALMQEQKRASKSRQKGQKNIDQRKWPTVTSKTKAMHSEQTSGKKKSALDKKKQHLESELSEHRLPEVILPEFGLNADDISSFGILSIHNATIGYNDNPLLTGINISISGKDRIAINGKNASGKSTLLKAILDDPTVIKTGNWSLPRQEKIGYLDQHYSTLNPRQSVIQHLRNHQPNWHETDIRRHLSHFLFNKDIDKTVEHLSGGEKARLSLCLIAAKPPQLLILDEITNNIDIETKEHIIQILKEYPGTLLIVSHEEEFLKAIEITGEYTITNGILS